MSRVLTLFFVLSVAAVGYAQSQTKTPAPAAPKPAAAPAKPVVKPAAAPAQRPAAAAAPVTPPAVAPLTEDEKTIYALGLLIQQSITPFDLSAAELDILKRALSDATAGKPAIDLDEWGPKVDPLANVRRARVTTREKAAGVAFLDTAAAEAGAVKTASGLVYRDVTVGSGRSPLASDTVKVNYRGALTNGTVFDSSYDRHEPMTFPLREVLPCWTEGVQRMKIGGKATLVCPSEIAYGEAGAPPTIPGGATLVFDVELLEDHDATGSAVS